MINVNTQDGTLKRIIDVIVNTINSEKIILFGSRAKSNIDDSDYDICILKTGIEKIKRNLSKQLYMSLFGVGAAVDIILESPIQFEELKDRWFLVHSEIEKFGVVIYEK